MNAAAAAIARIAGQGVGSLTGWQRSLAAFMFGVLSTLTLAPFFLFPLLVPSFSGLYWLVESAKSRRRLFWDGWFWGWGFFMTGLYWMCVALLTDAEKFAWLIPFALFGLTGLIAIYAGLACWLMSYVRARGISRIYVFSVLWMCVEYARGYLFSGFPWNLIGYSFGFSDTSIQLASLVGAYGLTCYSVLLGCSAAALGEKGGRVFVAVVWGSFALAMVWGQVRLSEVSQLPEDKRFVEGPLVRLVQANISQPHKWDPRLQMQGLKAYVQLTQSPGLEKVTHIIWPETAVPYTLQSGSKLARLLGESIPDGKILITGALRIEGEDPDWQIWNSLMAINHEGNIVKSYDKIRLVPFGEFQPLRDFVPKEWMTPVGDKDFSRGLKEQPLDWPGLPPMVPLICYEAIFPEMSMPKHDRPKMLLTVTNDAWFGMSTGPYQHFQMARMRAAEQGLPLLRVANTGISAVVDAYGRVAYSIMLGEKGFIDVKIPLPKTDGTTYNTCNLPIILLLIITMLALAVRRQRER